MPATRIAELRKVDRNTINNDLKIVYYKAMRNFNSDMYWDNIIEKQLLRLEMQRDRLGTYLCDTDSKDINTKLAIERQIADIDWKVIGLMERFNQSFQHYDREVIDRVNRIAEDKKLDWRYTNLFELYKISIDARQDLDKFHEKYRPGLYQYRVNKQKEEEQEQE
jgi:hypothetical protein